MEGLIGSKKSETSEETAEERIRQAAETHAEDLDLSNTNLLELPKSLGQLTALRTLDLNFNQLSALPESLGQLRALGSRVLDRSYAYGAHSDLFGMLAGGILGCLSASSGALALAISTRMRAFPPVRLAALKGLMSFAVFLSAP